MKLRICLNCLWRWDLYDTGEWKCYQIRSPYYHQTTEKHCTCKRHEDLVRNRMTMKIGYYKEDK
jgi:hypothetical protein